MKNSMKIFNYFIYLNEITFLKKQYDSQSCSRLFNENFNYQKRKKEEIKYIEYY